MKIGVLSLQGNYDMHANILRNIGVEPKYIRYTDELNDVKGLVIPGGESTAMAKIMTREGFFDSIKDFAKQFPVLGTCAGLIIMSEKIIDGNLSTLGLLEISTVRNGYGRQINSRTVQIDFKLEDTDYSIPASFIRAPMIKDYSKNVEVIAEHDGVPVIVKSGKHLAISFHPELDNVSDLHEYVFLGNSIN